MLIFLRDLRFHASHGVTDEELRVGTPLSVSVEVEIPYLCPDPEADDSGALANTLSYADLYEMVKRRVMEPTRLLETVALRLRDDILKRWPSVVCGSIEIAKLAPPIPGIQGEAGIKLNF